MHNCSTPYPLNISIVSLIPDKFFSSIEELMQNTVLYSTIPLLLCKADFQTTTDNCFKQSRTFQDTQQQTHSTYNSFCNTRQISSIKVSIDAQDTALFDDILFCCVCKRDSDNNGQIFHIIKFFPRHTTTSTLNLQQFLQLLTNFFDQGLNLYARSCSIQ